MSVACATGSGEPEGEPVGLTGGAGQGLRCSEGRRDEGKNRAVGSLGYTVLGFPVPNGLTRALSGAKL